MMYFFSASFTCYKNNGSVEIVTRYITIDRDHRDLQCHIDNIKRGLSQSYSKVEGPVVENISTPHPRKR